ncbi:NUDIX hydrolase [Flavihumibacter fluvii]|uniref:NUDIX hydrolase n=1 Tax=Flavihumibacter fluvii TaxID=2838157 RepID=UPI001BDE2453|nr:NUDIX domain-containing protein [Flavihumibacter fluvii]ULQ51368.1 NUDIX domain-containing protein [Flavihumibacter fluvii]
MKQISRFSHLGELNDDDYFRIALSVDCVIFGFEDNELKVLVIKCNIKEYKGKWSLLGDLVRPDEDIEAASYRILKERTGLDDVYLEQVKTFGKPNRHPAGRVITVAYFSLVNIKNHQLKLSDNELHWHPVNDITEMAFDHKEILQSCLDQLREKIEDHPLVFNLLPRKFSLRELQCLYEAILNTRLDRRNFRKKFFVMDWLTDLNELEEDVPHRPGKLYEFNKEKFDKAIRKIGDSRKAATKTENA